MSLFSELRTLSSAPEYQASIDRVEDKSLPIKERQHLVRQAIRAIAPLRHLCQMAKSA